MVHKKYIKRGGKTFGPYLYKNYRVNGVTKTKYLGRTEEERKDYLRVNKNILLVLGLGLFILTVVLVSYSFFERGLTGRASLELALSYSQGESITGSLNLVLRAGELIPVNSIIKSSLNEQENSLVLSEILGEGVEGSFYAENSELTGNGLGYGIEGSKEVYPEISFSLLIMPKGAEENITEPEENITQPEENITPPTENITPPEENITPPQENIPPEQPPAENIPQETPPEQEKPKQEKEKEKKQEKETGKKENLPEETTDQETTPPESAPITGAAVNEKKIDGVVSKNKLFTLQLGEGETAKIIPGSVKIDGKKVDSSLITLQISDNQAVISTDYKEIEKGFGEEYLTDETKTIKIPIENFNIKAEQGTLIVSLEYENISILEISRKINVEENITEENVTSPVLIKNIPNLLINKNSYAELNLGEYFDNADEYSSSSISNITIKISGDKARITPNENFTGIRAVKFVASNSAGSVESNLARIIVFNSNITLISSSDINLNEKAYFKKQIKLEDKRNLSLRIPVIAENITLTRIEEGNEEVVNIIGNETNTVPAASGITGFVTGSLDIEESIVEENVTLQKNATLPEETIENITINESIPVDLSLEDNIQENPEEIILQDKLVKDKAREIKVENVQEVVLEYYAPAPVSLERDISGGKEITISAELPYENVLAYTDISEVTNNPEKIKLYHIVEENFTDLIANEITNLSEEIAGTREVREAVNFTAYDSDNNSLLDYVEWIVPHLSNQTYELIIEISKAEHLSSNRTFISDIYEQVKEKDDNWSEVINNSEYVRVTFTQALDNSKDISIYARKGNVTIGNNSVPYDIYQKKKRIDEIRRQLGS